MSRILLFGGTGQARALAKEMSHRGLTVDIYVATSYGEEHLEVLPDQRIFRERLDEKAMAQVMAKGYDLCIDATHPFATEVSENIQKASARTGLKVIRLLREVSMLEGNLVVPDYEQAASLLAKRLEETSGRALLTTGSKTLEVFTAKCPKERLVVRMIPLVSSLEKAKALGLLGAQLILMEGPFSQAMNEVTLKEFNCDFLITKDSGRQGGFEEKIRACENLGVTSIVISRPKEEGQTWQQLMITLDSLSR